MFGIEVRRGIPRGTIDGILEVAEHDLGLR